MIGLTVTLAALLLVLAALLTIPVSLVVRLERRQRLKASVRVKWLFGLVDIAAGREGPAAAKTRERPSGERSWRGARIALAVLGTRGFVGRAARLPADLLRRVRCERFHLHATFGLEDPADTGRIYGALAPLLVAASARALEIRCQPSFLEACLEGSCGATLRLRPISVVGVVLGFVCSPPAFRAIRAAWNARR